MKKLFFAFFAIALTTLTNLSAKTPFEPNPNFKVEPTKDQKAFVIELQNIGNDVLTIELVSDEGSVLTLDRVKNAVNYKRKFILNELADGNYSLMFSGSTQ